jgi:hypothetical protein
MLISLALALAMFVALEMGHRVGGTALAGDSEAQRGTGAIEGAVFGLIGLILAFTFSGAQTRFDARRALIMEEAGAIATAYDRLDLLPESHRESVQELFHVYLDERIAMYRAGVAGETQETHRRKAIELQHEIWTGAEQGCRSGASGCAALVLPAVNAMGDIAIRRTVAQHAHVPWIIMVLMCVLATSGAALAGYALAARSARRWMHWVLLVVALTSTVYVILDLEHPRRGWIRLNVADAALIELRDRMK